MTPPELWICVALALLVDFSFICVAWGALIWLRAEERREK